MRSGDGLRIAVTGAAGFIGRAVVARLAAGALGPVAALVLNDLHPTDPLPGRFVQGTYADAGVRQRLIGDGVDVLFHLASLPGGASERDPALGRQVNLDGTLALIDAAAGPHAPCIVYTSSIAALAGVEGPVGPATALRPVGSYGTHKAMVELYLADLTRRGLVDARSVRPAGIVARPKTAFAGFATAWMSDLFHAAREGRDLSVPARAAAHIWLQSIDCVADSIVHAARMAADGLPAHRSWTLPATVVRVDALVGALGSACSHQFRVDYGDGPTDLPPLDASDALAAGFLSDGDTDALVAAVLSRLNESK